MKHARLYSAVLLAAAAALAGCEVQRKTSSTPVTVLEPSAAIPSLLGTWTTMAATPTADTSSSCTNFAWTVTRQTDTDIEGSFTAVCLGNTNITGTGTGHISGSTVTISISGNGSMPEQSNCPFSLSGTGTIEGEIIRVPYTGQTCLGPVSGTQTLSRSLVQRPPSAPSLLSPDDGATVTTLRPTLVVTNVPPQAPNDVMQYAFEVATDSAGSNRILAATIDAGSTTTSYTVPSDLSYGTRYYWRAKTIDAGRSSAFSSLRSFVTPAAPAPPTHPVPTPTNELDMRQATILNSPLDMASWAITTRITVLDLRPTGVHVEFSKRDGPGRWPDVYPPGWDEPLQYTLGMCLNVSGWYCSAPIQFWYGLDQSGGPPSEYAQNWFYDPSRWGPMSGRQPAPGEIIGFFVCEGNCRNNTTGSQSPLRERSNVVLIPFPGNGGGSFRF